MHIKTGYSTAAFGLIIGGAVVIWPTAWWIGVTAMVIGVVVFCLGLGLRGEDIGKDHHVIDFRSRRFVLAVGATAATAIVSFGSYVWLGLIREAKAGTLSDLLENANQLKNRKITTQQEYDVWNKDLDAWYSKSQIDFANNFPAYDFQLFDTMPPNTFYFNVSPHFNDAHNKWLNWLEWHITNLRFIRDKFVGF